MKFQAAANEVSFFFNRLFMDTLFFFLGFPAEMHLEFQPWIF